MKTAVFGDVHGPKREMLAWLHATLPPGAGDYVAALPTSATLAGGAVLGGEGDAWNVTFRRVPYDVDAAERWAGAHVQNGAQEAQQLRTGRDRRSGS